MKPVKVEPKLIEAVRHLIYEKCRHRLEPKVSDHGIGGFKDQAFVDRWGVAMQRLQDQQIMGYALHALITQLEAAPEGKTGIADIDGG